MIIEGGQKTKVLFVDGDRVYMVFDGMDLVYNCYVKPVDVEICLLADNSVTDDVLSNTSWSIN